MTTFIVAFFALLTIVAVMSIGVIFAKKPIAGTCGGMNALGMETDCDICGGDKVKCEKESKRQVKKAKRDAFYNAGK